MVLNSSINISFIMLMTAVCYKLLFVLALFDFIILD